MWHWLPAGLPKLKDGSLLLYRVTGLFGMTLALPSVLYFQLRDEIQAIPNTRLLYEAGLIVGRETAQGGLVSPFGPAARAAGIGDNEVLLAIDGVPDPGTDASRARLFAKPDGSRIRLTLKSSAGNIHEVYTRVDRRALDEAYHRVGLTFEGRRYATLALDMATRMLALVLATLLFLRRPRDPVAALLALGFTWMSVEIFSMFSLDLHWLNVARSASLAFAIVTGIAAFPDGRFTPRWVVLAIVSVALLVLSAEGAYQGVIPVFFPTLALIATFILLSAGTIVRYRRTPLGAARQQIKFATLGFAALALGAVLSNLFEIAAQGDIDEGLRAWLFVGEGVAGVGEAGFYLGMLVSLLRYRLYDAETAISRSAVVATLTLLLGAVFAASEKIVEVVGEQYFGAQGRATSAAIAAALAAILIAPLHGRVHRWTERRFQKGLLKLRDGLPALIGDLRETSTPSELAQVALERIEAGVRSRRGAILLGETLIAHSDIDHAALTEWRRVHPLGVGSKQFHCDNEDPLLPVRLALEADGCGRIGWLLLGPRPDDTLFGKDERETLADLADPLARALAIAARRETSESERQKEIGTLHRLVAGLQKRIERFEAKPQIRT